MCPLGTTSSLVSHPIRRRRFRSPSHNLLGVPFFPFFSLWHSFHGIAMVLRITSPISGTLSTISTLFVLLSKRLILNQRNFLNFGDIVRFERTTQTATGSVVVWPFLSLIVFLRHLSIFTLIYKQLPPESIRLLLLQFAVFIYPLIALYHRTLSIA